MAATIDQAADTGEIPDLEIRHLVTDSDDTADDLVTRNRRVERVLPFVTGRVQIGMAHAAEKNLDLNVVRPGIATFDFVRRECAALIDGGIGFGFDHDFSLFVDSRVRGCWAGDANCRQAMCSRDIVQFGDIERVPLS